MAKPTSVSIKDFYKAVQYIAVEKGYVCVPYKGKAASAVCYNIYIESDENDKKLVYTFCTHEDKKKKVIYTDDLKKPCKFFEITSKQFEEYINNGFNFPKVDSKEND